MANLIITVISIALVAVAALMGAYYGGQAFMDGQAKAKANTVAAGFSQVDAALQVYNSQTGSIYNFPGAGGGWNFVFAILGTNYLSAVP